MGIALPEAKALIEVYKSNGPLGRTATLGRQSLCAKPIRIKKMFRELGVAPHGSLDEFLKQPPLYAETFLRLLGATEVTSFDYSDFEGATVCHDMNLPIPENYHNSFDVVYDGGTLEHVFHFPQAIRNCMDMLRESGLFLSATPANNFMGHGFYQFSPELFFRLFSQDRGFRVERMMAFEDCLGGSWYEVADPKRLGRRIELEVTEARIMLWVVARKIREIPESSGSFPQQSDYSVIWADAPGTFPPPQRSRPRWKAFLADSADGISPSLADWVRRIMNSVREIKHDSLQSNKEAFRKAGC